MTLNLKDVLGLIVSARDGDVGTVLDLYFDDLQWEVRYLVGDTTGHWPGGRKVLIPAAAIAPAPSWGSKRMPVRMSVEEVKRSPQMDLAKPVSRLEEERLAAEYRWPAYWSAPSAEVWSPPGVQAQAARAGTGQPARERDREPLAEEDASRLRSVAEVMKYNLLSLDGATHRIAGLLAHEGAWRIAYLMLDVGTLLKPESLLVPSRTVTNIDWKLSAVHSRLKGEEIDRSPGHDPKIPITPEIESQAEHYYRRY